jgi:hypothetical protein
VWNQHVDWIKAMKVMIQLSKEMRERWGWDRDGIEMR